MTGAGILVQISEQIGPAGVTSVEPEMVVCITNRKIRLKGILLHLVNPGRVCLTCSIVSHILSLWEQGK
jgi:hypothetical protein